MIDIYFYNQYIFSTQNYKPYNVLNQCYNLWKIRSGS